MFDLKQYTMNLLAANRKSTDGVSVKITERTLGNNQDYEDMVAEKFDWPSVDGPSPVVYPKDQTPNEVIALQPQRIRLFRVEFDEAQVVPEQFLQ